MASQNERNRWMRWYDQVTERMERQKGIITRLVAINTEAIAALEEIADSDNMAGRRAQEALGRIKGSAAANTVEEASSYEEETPVEDPRGKQR